MVETVNAQDISKKANLRNIIRVPCDRYRSIITTSLVALDSQFPNS